MLMVPLTTDFSAWYAYQGLIGALVVFGLACYGFYTSLGGRPVFRKGFFGDD